VNQIALPRPAVAEAAVHRERIRWRQVFWVTILAVALAAGVAISRSLRPAHGTPVGLVAVSGRLEGDVVKLSGKQPGRIARLLAREGDTVKPGQLVVELEDETLRARHASVLAALAVAERRAQAAHAALDVARRAVPLELQAARAGVQSASSAVDKAELAATQAARDDDRDRLLLDRGVINQQQAEAMTLQKDLTSTETSAARSAHRRAVVALDQARLGDARLRASEADAAVLDAAVEQARAAVAEVASALAELDIEAPVGGTVTGRFVNVGEVVGAGVPLLEIVDLDALYLRAYLPEPEVGRVHLGCTARVYTDSDPEHPVPAELRYVAARAEFTPKEVQTADERVKLVYAVKLYLTENPDHRLTPGQSADAVIRWQNGVPWTRPRL
jgi:HlyD family secretion protein